jgi:Orotidine 5'-phosphate decarboxylase / HUMPS family
MSIMAAYLNTYADRSKTQVNPAAKELLETIERKQSNLCVSVDVTLSKDFLAIVDAVGPYISLIKASHHRHNFGIIDKCSDNIEARPISISSRTSSIR